MHRTIALGLSAALVGLAGCDDTAGGAPDDPAGPEMGMGGAGGAGGTPASDMGSPPDMPADCPGEQFFAGIAEDTTWRRACSPYRVQGALTINGGATLTIEAGVEVLLGGGAPIMVGQPGSPGGLQVGGTAEAPVVFDLLAGGPGGDEGWAGLRFDAAVLPSALTNVHLRGCGGAGQPCLATSNMDGQLAVRDLTIEDAALGVRIDETDPGTLEGLRFEGAVGVALEVHPLQVGGLTEAFEYPDGAVNRVDAESGSRVSASATWIDQGVPWHVRGDLVVQGPDDWAEGDPMPVLSLEAGVELLFEPEGKLHVGDDEPGGLVIAGDALAPVRIAPQPGEGDRRIKGLIFGALSRGSVVRGLHIEEAGFEAAVDSAHGCLSVGLGADAATEVSVSESTFADCGQAGIGAPRATDGFAFGALSGNTFRDAPYGVMLRPNHLANFTGDQTYDGVLQNAIVGGVQNRAPAILTVPATWVSQPVAYNVIDPLEVEADLTIEGPNTLTFEPETMLRVAEAQPAHLIAEGTADAPVVFQGAEDMRGGWHGIVFYPGSKPTSRLTAAVVRDGGAASGNVVEGCITVRGADTGPVAIVDTRVTRCERAGIAATAPGRHFHSLAGVRFDDVDVGLDLHPSTVADVDVELSYVGVAKNIVRPGEVAADGRWVAQGVPWEIGPDGNAPIIVVAADLTIDAGFTLTLPRTRPIPAGLIVGGDAPGRLVVDGTEAEPVVLRSAEPGPAADDWGQIRFSDRTRPGTTVHWLSIEHAGFQNRAAIELVGTGGDVRIVSPRFGDIAGPAIRCDGGSSPDLDDVPPGAEVVACP